VKSRDGDRFEAHGVSPDGEFGIRDRVGADRSFS